MPKKPIDYSKTIIYKLVCKDLSIIDLYVGHTTDFKSRKRGHKQTVEDINCEKYNLKKSKFIRDNGGWNNWDMIQIELYPCNDVHEACARERYWYETLGGTLNSKVPSRSQKEYVEANKEQIQKYKKEYREAHKEQIQQQMKEYYEENKDKFQARITTKYVCECGAIIQQNTKYKHLKTLKHCEFLKTNNI